MNDQQRAAMQMALGALEGMKEIHKTEPIRQAITALREALAQPQGEPVACPDKGPWEARQWGTEKVVLLSDDFEHDVTLVVKGDFVTEDRFRYASQLAAWMNHCLTTPQTVEAFHPFNENCECAACLNHFTFKEYAVAKAIEATKEKAAKVCESEKFAVWETAERIAAAIRSMK